MKILIVTDAWPPVTSGVVRTYQTTIRHLKMMGHQVDLITPDQFVTVRCPTDNQQRLALYAGRKTGRLIEASQPDAIHVATEGPLGLAAQKLVREALGAVHDLVHDEIARILPRSRQNPHALDLCRDALVPPAGRRHHGFHADVAKRTYPARVSKTWSVGAGAST